MQLVRLEPPLTNTLLRFSIVKEGVFSAHWGVWDGGRFYTANDSHLVQICWIISHFFVAMSHSRIM